MIPSTQTTTAAPATTVTPVTSVTTVTTLKTAEFDFSKMAESTIYSILKGDGAPENAIGLIINDPTKTQLDEAVMLRRYVLDESGDELLIVPRFDGMKIQIINARYDGEELFFEEPLYYINYTEDATALLLTADRPETPRAVIVLTAGEYQAVYELAKKSGSGLPELVYLQPHQ